MRVLVVDDDMHVLAMLAETLRAEGYETQTALDGAHALQKIATADDEYDLLIVDGRMPHLDGCRFVMQARAGGYSGHIIIFSAYLDADERKRYRTMNVTAVIDKPPRPGELMNAVRKIAAEVA